MAQIAPRSKYVVLVATAPLTTSPTLLESVTVSGDDAGTTCVLDIYDFVGANSNRVYRWVTADGKGTRVLNMPITAGLRVVCSGTLPTNGAIIVTYSPTLG